MAGDQLSTIRQLVLDRYAGSTSDQIFDTDVLDRIINVSNKRLGRVKDWPWLHNVSAVALTAGDESYDLSAFENFRHIKYLAVGNHALTYKFPQAFVAVNNLQGTRPGYYTIIGNTLLVSPIPTEAVSIDIVYVVDEQDLVTDSDRPMLPVGYTELLVLSSLAAIAMRRKDTEYYNLARQEYKQALLEAMDEVQRTRQNPQVDADTAMWSSI